MKKIFTHSKLYNVLFLSASTLFVITLSGRTIAMANSSAINSALGITTTNKGNDADAQYFKRTFTDAKDVKDYVSKAEPLSVDSQDGVVTQLSKEKEVGEGVGFERIRRITGYLVGTVDRFNNGKRAEEHDRVKHGLN